MAASTTRPMNGMAAMVKGTTAARVPIEVPTIRRVNGTMATTRMMKGVERVALTMRPRMRLAAGEGNSSLARLVARKTPSGSPNRVPSRPERPTMIRVSSVDQAINWAISGDITKMLHRILSRRQLRHDPPQVVRIGGNRDEQRPEWTASDRLHLPVQDVDVEAKISRQPRQDRLIGFAAGKADPQHRVVARLAFRPQFRGQPIRHLAASDGADEPLRRLVTGMRKDLVSRALLHDAAALEHRDAVGELFHHHHFVGDEQDRQLEFGIDRLQQPENLVSRLRIECG